MNVPKELQQVVLSDPEILGGTLCFRGTRVPVEIFIDYMEDGCSLDRFLQGYPSVHRAQATAILEWQGQESRRAFGFELL